MTEPLASIDSMAANNEDGSPLGVFAKVPQEIRDIIYSFVFTAGYTALARTSKAMNMNTLASLRKYGIYRVHIEYHQQFRTFEFRELPRSIAFQKPLPRNFLYDAQNLDLRITHRMDLGQPKESFDPSYEKGNLAHLVRNAVFMMKSNVHCRVSLENSWFDFKGEVLQSVAWLRVFRKVNVEVWQRVYYHRTVEFDRRCRAVAVVKSTLGLEGGSASKLTIVWTDPKNSKRDKLYRKETYDVAELLLLRFREVF